MSENAKEKPDTKSKAGAEVENATEEVTLKQRVKISEDVHEIGDVIKVSPEVAEELRDRGLCE